MVALARIAVVGGGTAGYLAALTLKAVHSDLDVTVIESSRIPVIGVGESTTSEIVPFLHSVLRCDVMEFYRRVLPTLKLGIKFVWGPPENGYFNYPFDRGPILETRLHEGHIRQCSPAAALMSADRGLILDAGGTLVSLLPVRPYGYHLDNRRFVRYLSEEALKRGIRHIDDEIADVTVDPNGGLIDHLVLKAAGVVRFDFYVDCTGFRSLLTGGALGTPFISYASSLYADSAVVANVGHDGCVKPYTTAATMDSGWCWNIPQLEEDHLGYVFSSAFCSEDAALRELQSTYPELHDPWVVRFRSGRHEHFVRGNVAAIGNSYGFVEPLESTAIFLVCRECLLLAQNITHLANDLSIASELNARIGSIADYLRWFLSVHYKFNSASETRFWQECRRAVNISGAEAIVSQFQEAAPLSYASNRFSQFVDGANFDAFGYDVILIGQGVDTQYRAPVMEAREYQRYHESVERLVSSALPQTKGLERCLQEAPELLVAAIDGDGWVQHTADAMLGSGLRH